MRKLIAAINMTLDGSFDHEALDPDEEIHEHYSVLLKNSGTILYGRITYQLMEAYWPSLVKNPSGIQSMDEFARAIDQIPKIVFSNTMKKDDPSITGWNTAKLADKDLQDVVAELRQQQGRDILVGSRSLIIALLNLNLIDELQLCIHPILTGNSASPLFNNIESRKNLQLVNTKTFPSGAIILYYNQPGN